MKRFQCHIEADLVAIAEAVYDRPRRGCDPDLNALNIPALYGIAQHLAGKSDDPDGKICESRLSGLSVERDPDLARNLCSNFMHMECGEKAYDGLGHPRRDHCDGLQLGWRRRTKTIESASDPFHLAPFQHASETMPGKAEVLQVTGTKDVRDRGGPCLFYYGGISGHDYST